MFANLWSNVTFCHPSRTRPGGFHIITGKTSGRTRLHNCQKTDNPLVGKSFTVVLINTFHSFKGKHGKTSVFKSRRAETERGESNRTATVQNSNERLMLRRFSNYRRIWVIFPSKIREKSHMLTKAAYVVSHRYTKAKAKGRRKLISNIPYHSSFLLL